MMHKMKRELVKYLEKGVKKKSAIEKVSFKEILELQRNCRDYLSTENIGKIYARMMKKEIRKIMVETVYRALISE